MNHYLSISSVMYLMHPFFKQKSYIHFIRASEYMLLFKRPMNSQKLLENGYKATSEKAQKMN